MPRRRFDVKLLLASLGIAAGIVLVVAGVGASVTGREQQRLPDEVESIDPIRGATQIPQQTRVFVDLIIGYTGVLVIDGIEPAVVSLNSNDPFDPETSTTLVGATSVPLAGDQAEQETLAPGTVFEPGNFTLTFEPQPGNVIESFSTGLHTATVIYWKIDESRNQSRAFSWEFYVV